MDIETAKKIIKKHTQGHSDFVTNCIVAERYFRNKNDILYLEKQYDSDIENPLRNADNRIPRNFYGLLVNQKASYLFTAPPTFDVGKDNANIIVNDLLGDIYAKNCKDLCINASNAGIAWLHYWANDDSEFEYGIVDSKQVIPVWCSHLNKKLIAVLRVYKNTNDDGETFDVYEYWTAEKCCSYCKAIEETPEDGLFEYDQFVSLEVAGMQCNEFNHDFGRVPFIPFQNNNIATSDLDNVKSHIDVYDKVYSGFVNDLEDIQEIIFLLTNYQGQDLATFLSDIKKYKTVKLESSGGDDRSGLETLTIDIPIEAREKLLDITRKAIFEQGQGVDPQPREFGNASGVALKYLYSLLELKSGLMETEFRLGFGELVRAICAFKGIEVKNIVQTWTRTAITNDSELTTMCKDSTGIISKKTIVKNHPFVENADDEIKQLTKEKEEQQSEMETYKSAFSNQGGVGDAST